MGNIISVLFVDDEPNVLTSIKRMLRFKRNEWDIEFAESGEEALDLFDKKIFDVVVSDIRMPGMDGAELLTRLKDEYPGVIRIALSGQVGLSEVVRSIRAVHQYISKPCDAETLVTKIESALKSREILTDPAMQRLVTEIDALPVIPSVFKSIEDELRKEEPSISKIANLISKDVGLVAKILKLINSPYFGLPSNIKSISQAISLLGLETIKTLILGTHLFSMYDEKALPKLSLSLLWEHSFRVSNIARLIAEKENLDKNTIIQVRMAGLLHDVGKLILAYSFPEKYSQVLDKIRETKDPINRCELSVFGTTHAQIGAYLMGLWGMSGEVVHGIGYHHSYDKCDLSIPMIVSVADMIDHQCVIINPDYGRIVIDESVLPPSSNAKLEEWISHISLHWQGITDFNVLDSDVIEHLRK
ncbi:response regulator [Maridesulfovibrio frigidus]|uniref:response regulator n=1 Tax=Maridesulfovibrio frigidus TaxID=340956 RepID=UPI0004E16894|nr:response regulator [Maridesulfovibrio frigidus]